MKQKQSTTPTLLGVVRQCIRLRHLSYSTEKSYLYWIRRFVLFHNKRHPKQMGEPEVVAFLSDLAINRTCSPSTQNQALNALSFLFKHVLNRQLGECKGIQWARQRQRMPVVMTREEVNGVLAKLENRP